MKAFRAILAVFAMSAATHDMSVEPQTSSDDRRREIRQNIDQGRYPDAERLARTLFESLRSLAGADRIDVYRAGDLLVEASIRNGRGADAETRTLAEELVRRRELDAVGDGLSLATAVRNLGDLHFQAGQYPRAAVELQRAVRIRETAAPDDPSLADNLDRLAVALSQIGRHDDALAASNRALVIREKTSEPERGNVALARTLEARSLVWQRRGEYVRARPDAERALAIRQDANPNHPDVAATLTRLGYQLLSEGDHSRAQQFLERAVAVAEAALRTGHPDIASFLRILAIPVQSLGDLARARALQERALAIAEGSLGRDHPLVADCLNDLAGTLFLQAEYTAARPLFERAISTYERTLGADYPGIATPAHNSAILNARLGDFTRARAFHQRALASWQRVVGSEHPIFAWALTDFGQTLAEQGLDAEARTYLERALVIRRRILGNEHPLVAQTLSSLADSLSRLGQRQRALDLSQQALDIWQKTASPEWEAFSKSLLVRGRILAGRGDYAGAIAAYDRALQVRLPGLGALHPAVAEVQAARASVLALLGRREEALTLALEAEQTGRDHLRLMLGSLAERQALEYASTRPRGLGLALSLALDPNAGASVLDAVIRGRSLVLDEMASRGRLLANEKASALAPRWAALRSARQRLANLVIQGPGQDKREQYAARLEAAQRDKEDAERALAEESTAFRSEQSRADSGLRQIRTHLPPRAALVSFVRYERTSFSRTSAAPRPVSWYVAFVVRPNEDAPKVVELGSASAIDALITSWRSAMLADITAARAATQSGPSFRTLGTSLRQKVWDPLAAHLGGAQQVFVVPDGGLNLVPLTALPLARGRYVLEDGPVIHYLSAERDLVVADSASQLGSGLLAVGNPAFADPSSFAALRATRPAAPTAPASRPMTTPARRGSVTCVSFQSMRFDPIPESRREVDAVASQWQQVDAASRAGDARALIGAEATERAFKQLGPGRRILHLATHGFFLSEDCATAVQGTRSVGGVATTGAKPVPAAAAPNPLRRLPENPLLFSGLALAGANRRAAAGPDEEDGVLTAEEVATLNLDGIEWAVLSACDTGLGAVAAGEGVFGLRRAFQVAGARTVIMSLWSVDDRAARDWMAALYQARLEQKLDTAGSARAASLALLRDRRAKGASTHPFFWAAFVAAGDWR
jgi:CHAT domain-containing protein/Tfp pilus assembly protein PilF